MDKIEKICQEIERRLKDYWEICFHDVKAYNEDSNVRELKELLSFLDTLSEEPDKEDLNDEIKKFIEEYGYERGGDKLLIAIVARHFAEWQKSQMLKDAMEGQIYGSDGDHWIESEIYENLKGKEGDKVRIIVLKDEEYG